LLTESFVFLGEGKENEGVVGGILVEGK